MVSVKLISGLGNQLFQYTLARQIAILNNSPLKLDLSFFENQNLRSYKLDNYKIEGSIATNSDIEKINMIFQPQTFYSRLYLKFERHLPKQFHRYYKQTNWWDYEPGVYKIRGDVYLDGYWQNHHYFKNIDRQILTELSLKDEREIANYSIISQVIQNESSVSIHIRRGDYLTDKSAESLMGVLPIDYYYNAIKKITQKVQNPTFFVFSDDLQWAKDHLKIDFPMIFVDIANGTKDYLELEMMKNCRHNIIANSTFSWWGGFLNKNPQKVVIAPYNWAKPVTVNNQIKLQFPSWIKI